MYGGVKMDSGNDQLDLGARQALVNLLRGPSIDGSVKSQLWPLVVQHELVLRSRLRELFLELVVDHDQKIAFTRQIDEVEGEAVPLLLRRVNLTFIQSVLVLYLRAQLVKADTMGSRAVVSGQELLDHLEVYRRQGDTNLAGFQKACQGAMDKVCSYNLLRPLEGGQDRFEVSPALRLVFPVEQVAALAQAYARLQDALVEASAGDPAGQADDVDDSGEAGA